MDNLTGKPRQQVVPQPAKIIIEQDPKTGQFQLSHNITKPLYLIGIITTTLNGVVDQTIRQDQMVIDPNKPRIVPSAPQEPEPTPKDKVQ